MLREMPCGKVNTIRYWNPEGAAPRLKELLKAGTWIGIYKSLHWNTKSCMVSLRKCRQSSSSNKFKMNQSLNIWRITASVVAEKEVKKAGWSVGRGKAVAVCHAVALVCGTWGSYQSCSSHDRLSDDEDLHVFCGAGNKSPPQWRHR